MGELSVERLLRRLSREEFNAWYVAYHELHLDGARNAAAVAAAVHNALRPVHAFLGLETEPTTIDEQLPAVLFGDERSAPPADSNDVDWERLAAAKWG